MRQLEGEIEVRHGGDVIATRGAGSYVGEISLIDHRPRPATVVAKSPVVIDVIGQRGFATLLEQEPEIAEKIKATATARLAELGDSEH
jgi:CRP-like cAMP-binding protein